MKQYHCKHRVEALRWEDTDARREVFADWFESHDARFETRGPVVVLPEEGEVAEGDWVVCSDGDLLVMSDETFQATYAAVDMTTCPSCGSSSPEHPRHARVLIWPPAPVTSCQDAWHTTRAHSYKCVHRVEALRWADTPEDRGAFTGWFATHAAVFETRGANVVLPNHAHLIAEGAQSPAYTIREGLWVIWDGAWDDENFMALDDESFRATYEEIA